MARSFSLLLHSIDLNKRVRPARWLALPGEERAGENDLVERRRACFIEKNLILGLFGIERDQLAGNSQKRFAGYG
jgi:hypothetical protein